MNLSATLTGIAERLPLPDRLTRAGIKMLVESTRRRLSDSAAGSEAEFAAAMSDYPIAEHPDSANTQHYELPAEFFTLILGPRRKYSCCYYDRADDLTNAEADALALTAEHADLADGQSILELGCGWGSLSLWMAERFPRSSIVAVSNSESQRRYIEDQAARRGIRTLQVVTADMNVFGPGRRFDRIVSVEMWEHMSNWQALLGRVRQWLHDDGRLFLHVFSHHSTPYRFDHTDRADWIAQHFFTGGVMPSHGMIRHLDRDFELEVDWRWSGEHYRRTAEEWLQNFDSNAVAIETILRRVYGDDTALWMRRWRLFFLATAGLFGTHGGSVWGVSHYRLQPRPMQ
jgi:cyclopropane-fatty-acyl-phospholipid synthase